MNLNTICKKHILLLLLIFSLIMIFLISCSIEELEITQSSAGTVENAPETAVSIERSPEIVEEATSVDSSREIIEEKAVSAKSSPEIIEAANNPVDSAIESTGKAAEPVENTPNTADFATAPIESILEIAKDAATSAGNSAKRTEKAAASVKSNPKVAEKVSAKDLNKKPVKFKSNKLDTYKAVLGADEKMMSPGFPGELSVWIGSSNYKPKTPSRTNQDSTMILIIEESAKVTPFAPAFEIEPAITQCIIIHPSGSEVLFKLTPRKSGTFDVGANISLFNSPDCTGPPVPKTVATLKVAVEVKKKETIFEKTKALGKDFWEKILEYWSVLIATLD